MGHWVITIEGYGQNHNNGDPKDADVIGRKCVEELKAAGHSVVSGSFGYVNEEYVKLEDPTGRHG